MREMVMSLRLYMCINLNLQTVDREPKNSAHKNVLTRPSENKVREPSVQVFMGLHFSEGNVI